jgi:hypothetical protein
MTLQDLGSIGEFVGAIATVATLAYLAMQLRQNSVQLRESSRMAQMSSIDRTVESFSRYRGMLAEPQNAEVYTRGLESYAKLSATDKVRFGAIIEEYFFAYSALYNRVANGGYHMTTWTAQANSGASVLENPGVAEWWADRKFIYSDDFVTELEGFVERRAAS